MKVEDLMIGDWVQYTEAQWITEEDSLPRKITGLGNPKYPSYYPYIRIEGMNEDYHIDLFQPIPISPEILEKNKLKHRFSDSDFAKYEEWYSEDRRFRVIKDKNGYYAKVEDENLMYTKAMGIANYVHELQHIVKHAKYEKEIVL